MLFVDNCGKEPGISLENQGGDQDENVKVLMKIKACRCVVIGYLKKADYDRLIIKIRIL